MLSDFMEHFILRTEALIIDAIIVTLLFSFIDNILYILLALLNIQVTLDVYKRQSLYAIVNSFHVVLIKKI